MLEIAQCAGLGSSDFLLVLELGRQDGVDVDRLFMVSEERVRRKRFYFAPRHLQMRALASSNERILVKLFRTGVCRLRLEVPRALVRLAARAEEVLFLAPRCLRFDSSDFVFNVLHGRVRP